MEILVISSQAPGGWRTLRSSGCGFSRISSSSRKQLWVGHVFFRFSTSGLQELVEAEEFAAKRPGIRGPLFFPGFERQRGAHCGELGIEVVEIMENHGLPDHRQFWRAKLIFPVVADEHMLYYDLQVFRKTFDGIHLPCDRLQLQHDVAQKLALGGIADGAVVAEFVQLSNVMKDGGSQKQVEIQLD